jgi:hypothetical protein
VTRITGVLHPSPVASFMLLCWLVLECNNPGQTICPHTGCAPRGRIPSQSWDADFYLSRETGSTHSPHTTRFFRPVLRQFFSSVFWTGESQLLAVLKNRRQGNFGQKNTEPIHNSCWISTIICTAVLYISINIR